ncbi:hypothetical protein HNP38_003174 [Chryseobacterium defluvii]|uniref:Uncharacterized protein n=1 Tax=Chryseobacterium defluvii TaxID=160396 RepID=A0A840KIK9_9FLAO|nr:hypothetical protein [Chryseobacterium defluvii]MBB4807858.1 hypothetical protein [Chryseobacterium defluvii]
MKPLLTLIITFFCTATVYADCAGTGLWIFPSRETIKQNSVFILDGYAESQNVILGLNKKHNIYLKSGSKKIKLLVTEICVGEFYLTQAVLKPETKLEAGLEYTMYIDNLPEYEDFNKYNAATHKYEPVTYKVTAENDTEKPQIPEKPKELKKTLVHYGCGPSTHVVFSNPAKDKSDIIVKTTVKNLKTGKETTYYIEPDGKEIRVGHGMCSGAFKFDDNNNYEVEFSFMDASGNLKVWTGERIKFTKPTKETNHDNE